MKIPIRNLYYLFLYAWARFPGGKLADAGVDSSPDLPNLFARLLSSGTRRILRRGLDRGYQSFTEELATPRGRLRIDRMVKETTLLRGTAVCDFDELSHNVLHNRILKATLHALAGCRDVEAELRHELRTLVRRLHDVEDVRLSASCFRRVTVSRSNREYYFLIRLCEFVFWSLMPDSSGTGARFQQVLEDEVRMSAVFEEFLRNFYQLHQPDYQVRAESPPWDVSDTSPADLALLPRMLTDITLRGRDQTIIIDAKYYREPLARSAHGERVRSAHLYQMLAYLKNERARNPGVPLTGILLYPEVGRRLRLRYRLLGLPLLVVTIDLGQAWPAVEAELNAVIVAARELLEPRAGTSAAHVWRAAQLPPLTKFGSSDPAPSG